MTLDGNTALVIIVVIFAIVALAAMWRYRHRIGIDIQAGEAKLGVKGENEPTAAQPSKPATTPAQPQSGARIADVEAGKDVRAKDATGAGASVERAKAAGNITASSENPPAPKA